MRHYTKAQYRRGPRRAKTPDGLPDLSARMPSPPVYRAGDYLPPAAFEWAGCRVEIPLRQLGWQHRSDQVAALIGGEWIVTTKTAVLRELAKMAPRVANKQMQRDYA